MEWKSKKNPNSGGYLCVNVIGFFGWFSITQKCDILIIVTVVEQSGCSVAYLKKQNYKETKVTLSLLKCTG